MKAYKDQLTLAESKLEEIAIERKRDKTLLMQKENKISTLEAKLEISNPSPVETKVKQYAALKNPNMRQVQAGTGKITKAVDDAEKFVIDSITKRPSATKSQDTPKDNKN